MNKKWTPEQIRKLATSRQFAGMVRNMVMSAVLGTVVDWIEARPGRKVILTSTGLNENPDTFECIDFEFIEVDGSHVENPFTKEKQGT